jgi:hypothetical protein
VDKNIKMLKTLKPFMFEPRPEPVIEPKKKTKVEVLPPNKPVNRLNKLTKAERNKK